MHGRGKLAAAPASDVAMHEGRRCLRVEPHPVFFFSFRDTRRLASTRSRRELICAKLGWFAPIGAELAKYRCVSAGKRKSADEGKKKKKLKPKIPRRYRRHNLTPFFFFFFLFFAGAQRTFYSVLFLLVDKFCFCFLKRIVKCLC